MGEGRNLLELSDGDLRVDLGGVEFHMPKELLDVADTGQSFTREPPEKTCGLTASSARSSSRPQRCLYRRGFCNHFHRWKLGFVFFWRIIWRKLWVFQPVESLLVFKSYDRLLYGMLPDHNRLHRLLALLIGQFAPLKFGFRTLSA